MLTPSPHPPRQSEGQVVIHAFRNAVFALHYGVLALEAARADEQAFKTLHTSVCERIKSMSSLLVQLGEAFDTESHRTALPVRVLCVDDNLDTTAVMRMLIDAEPQMHCVGCLSSADGLIDQVRRVRLAPPVPLPEHAANLVILLDASMPGVNPMLAMAEIAREFPEVKTVIYSATHDPGFVRAALGAGAWACISKDSPPAHILRVVRVAAAALDRADIPPGLIAPAL